MENVLSGLKAVILFDNTEQVQAFLSYCKDKRIPNQIALAGIKRLLALEEYDAARVDRNSVQGAEKRTWYTVNHPTYQHVQYSDLFKETIPQINENYEL